jgi:sec-independent protein translocase protein TatA
MLPGSSEWLIIFGVALLLFGPSKLPQLGGAIGASIRNFKKGMKGVHGDDDLQEGSSSGMLTEAKDVNKEVKKDSEKKVDLV